MDDKKTLTLLKAFDIGVSYILVDFNEEELLEKPLKTNTNKFFLEDICILLDREIKRHGSLLKEANKKIFYFDILYCLTNVLIDKEIITSLEDTEDEKYKNINEKAIMEIILAFMCFSKWKIKDGAYQEFDYKELESDNDAIKELKEALLKAIISKNILMICCILERIYYSVVLHSLNLDSYENIAKDIKIIHANSANLSPKYALGFRQHKQTFRDAYLRTKGYEIRRLTNERKRKNTQD